MSYSKGLQAILVILTFLFLPRQSRVVYFATTPVDYYGEIGVTTPGKEYVSIVENAYDLPISPSPSEGFPDLLGVST